MSAITYEIGNRLQEDSIYKMVMATMKNTLIRFFAKILVFLIIHSTFFQKMILKGAIANFKEIILMLIGYGEIIKNLPIEIVSSDHKSIQKTLPVYNHFYNFLNKLETRDELLQELFEVSREMVEELESLEATLEIYSNASDLADLIDAENDLKSNKEETFSLWVTN